VDILRFSRNKLPGYFLTKPLMPVELKAIVREALKEVGI